MRGDNRATPKPLSVDSLQGSKFSMSEKMISQALTGGRVQFTDKSSA